MIFGHHFGAPGRQKIEKIKLSLCFSVRRALWVVLGPLRVSFWSYFEVIWSSCLVFFRRFSDQQSKNSRSVHASVSGGPYGSFWDHFGFHIGAILALFGVHFWCFLKCLNDFLDFFEGCCDVCRFHRPALFL